MIDINGFTLIETQLYICTMVFTIIMVTHIALGYKNLYDKIALDAQRSIAVLAAVRKINELCDKALLYDDTHKTFDIPFYVHERMLSCRLNRSTIIFLDDVDLFSAIVHIRNRHAVGVSFMLTYAGGKQRIAWYHALSRGIGAW